MSWLTQKDARRTALLAALVGSLAGGVAPETSALIQGVVDALLQLYALW